MFLFAEDKSSETFNIVEPAVGGQIAALFPLFGFPGHEVPAVAVSVEPVFVRFAPGVGKFHFVKGNGQKSFPVDPPFDGGKLHLFAVPLHSVFLGGHDVESIQQAVVGSEDELVTFIAPCQEELQTFVVPEHSVSLAC